LRILPEIAGLPGGFWNVPWNLEEEMPDPSDRFQPGRMLPEIILITPPGRSLNLGSRRNRNNLLLVFLSESTSQDSSPLLDALIETEREFEDEATEVFVITASAHLAELLDRSYPEAPFLIVHPSSTAPLGRASPAREERFPAVLMLVDRFGEIISMWRLITADLTSDAVREKIADALAEVRFIELQCPE